MFLMPSARAQRRLPARKGPTTQVFLSGTGTYFTRTGVLWIRITMCGGGSGGGGSGTSPGAAGVGVATTFGTNLLAANGGQTGVGGTATGGYRNHIGQTGQGVTNSTNIYGGNGGSSALIVGGGFGGAPANPGMAAVANSGGGGGGAGDATTVNTGQGGSGGGSLVAVIDFPLASYPWAVGGGGAGGTAGTGGSAGGAGAAGGIWIEEFYNF